MKHLISILILISGICLGQKTYYLLPENQSFKLCEKYENELVKLEEFKFDYTELYAFDADELVIVNNDSKKFHYGRIQNLKFEEILIQNFPEKFKINTIELKDEFVYLGGNWDSGELFYVFDVNSKEFHPVPIPKEVYQPGKAIDDILFLDEKIIVVDNIVEPKYLIEYSTKDLPHLKDGEFFKLPFNGAYEHIYKGSVNEEYLVLFSSTYSGWIGGGNHISILKSEDLNSNFSLSSIPKSFSQDYMQWNDFLVVKNKIFIAFRDKSLGVFTIKEQYFLKSENKDIRSYKDVSTNKIKMHSEFENKPIKLLPFDSDSIIVILENEKGQKSFELIKI